jgi:hypothetical protein
MSQTRGKQTATDKRLSQLDHPTNLSFEQGADSRKVQMMIVRLEYRAMLYAFVASKYGALHHWYMAPALFLTAMVSVLVAIEPEDVFEDKSFTLYAKMTLSLMSALSTFLISIDKMNKYEYKKEAFECASQHSDSFTGRLRTRHQGLQGYTSRSEVQDLIDMTEEKMGEIRSGLPSVPPKWKTEFEEQCKEEPCVKAFKIMCAHDMHLDHPSLLTSRAIDGNKDGLRESSVDSESPLLSIRE